MLRVRSRVPQALVLLALFAALVGILWPMRGVQASSSGSPHTAWAVFIRGSDNYMWFRRWDTSWGAWQRISTTAVGSTPAAASWNNNHVDVFALSSDWRSILHWYSDDAGNTWTYREALTPVAFGHYGNFVSPPAVVSWGPNRWDVVALVYNTDVGGNQMVYWAATGGTSWTNFDNLDGRFIGGSIAEASWGTNRLDWFGLGLDYKVWHGWYDNGSWHLWSGTTIDSNTRAHFSAASWGYNRMDLAGIDSDTHMTHIWYTNFAADDQTYQVEHESGLFPSGVMALSTCGPTRLDAYGTGGDSGPWHLYSVIGQGTWYGWEPLGSGRGAVGGAVCFISTY